MQFSVCTGPPSAPRNLNIEVLSSNKVVLTWDKPEDLGGRGDLTYRVFCPNCSKDVIYSPGWKGFNKTRYVFKECINADKNKTWINIIFFYISKYQAFPICITKCSIPAEIQKPCKTLEIK